MVYMVYMVNMVYMVYMVYMSMLVYHNYITLPVYILYIPCKGRLVINRPALSKQLSDLMSTKGACSTCCQGDGRWSFVYTTCMYVYNINSATVS